MKKIKNRNHQLDEKYYDEYENYAAYANTKKDMRKRRPVRNWKKAWDVHETDYDEIDDFYNK